MESSEASKKFRDFMGLPQEFFEDLTRNRLTVLEFYIGYVLEIIQINQKFEIIILGIPDRNYRISVSLRLIGTKFRIHLGHMNKRSGFIEHFEELKKMEWYGRIRQKCEMWFKVGSLMSQ